MHLNGLNGTGRAKDSKILVLAAFFAYFLPLLAKSMSPKAIPKQKQEDSPLGNPPAFTSVHQALQLLRGEPAQEYGVRPAV